MVQLLNEQILLVLPSFLHTPRVCAMEVQPSTEHAVVLRSCFPHFPPIVVALLLYALSKGAVLDAEKPAKDLRGVAV